MAERRMFAKTIVLSDAFLDMPLSARCLYFTLGMFADDDGFVNSPKGIMRQAGCSEDDMKVLLAKKFLLVFDNGVIVIKHWRINNYLRNDRYVPTKYGVEKAILGTDENGAYTLSKPVGIPNSGIPNIGDTQDRLDKDSKDKVTKSRANKFTPPTLEQVKEYANENGLNVDCERFYTYFTTPNDAGRTWIDSKGNPVKNWKQKLITWAGRERPSRPKSQTFFNYEVKPFDPEECERSTKEIEKMLEEL